jgi:short subunit dehydrogenase-like uncharacterized protein
MHDLILFGATGFTGRQAAQYLAQQKNLNWALAGRNKSRLEELHRSLNLSDKVGIIEADSLDQEAVRKMVNQTKVVATTAGPYAKYGEYIVSECAAQGVHYLDITGETAFIRRMMDRYGKKAKETGAIMIPFSGFDSVPADLGVYYIHRELGSGTIKDCEGYYSVSGSFNGGTLLSALNMMESGDFRMMEQPDLLLGDLAGTIQTLPDPEGPRHNGVLGAWGAPFLMARINTRVVYRSAALFHSWGNGYGQDFSYREFHKTGSTWNPVTAFMLHMGMEGFELATKSGAMRSLIRRMGPAAGEGPSEQQRKAGRFTLEIAGQTTTGACVFTMDSEGDPGNISTVRFLCESALALVQDREDLPGGRSRCGFLTPASALGDVLIKRLENCGVRFSFRVVS